MPNLVGHCRVRMLGAVAGVFFLFWLLLLGVTAAHAMQPPRPGEIGRYRQDGTLAARQRFALATRSHRVDPALVVRKVAQAKAAKTGETVPAQTFPYRTGLPSKGSPRVFALLIDFADHPHVNNASVFTSKLFGTGIPEEKPYESLRYFYRRSSYYDTKPAGEALDIQGDVLPWYRAQKNRWSYNDPETLIKEALDFHSTSRDLSVYDNDGDGQIDFFMVFYTGPDTGWGTLWWAWFNRFEDNSYTVDGKGLFSYCFQWESSPVGNEFSPRVVIHETGHGLGLPDYYDYDDTVGPMGGVGGLDMMDSNWGDHNAFSKWLLDWVTPTIVGTVGDFHSLTLRPSSLYPDAAIIMPGQTPANPFAEYFLVQNRSRREQGVESGHLTSNDFDHPADGIVIWHVDARLNATQDGFEFNNSYTGHKLLRLMEADGRESIEQGYSVDADDFYTQNQYISGFTTPSTRDYGLHRTGVNVFNVNRAELMIFPITPISTYTVDLLIEDARVMSIGDAVDNSSLRWVSGGSQSGLGWYGQATTYLYDLGAAQNTTPGHSQYSSMAARVRGPAPLKFFWKVSSEADADYLELHLDGVLQDRISGEVDWAQKSLIIPEGDHHVMWKYVKNTSISAGADCGWVDRVECGVVPLEEAVDNPLLTMDSGGDAAWYGQTLEHYYGGSAAQSGMVRDGQSSTMDVLVSGGSTITFDWKVSSEEGGDYLEFWIDSTRMASISGEVGWHRQTFTVPLVPIRRHSASWRYVKNSRGSEGADSGWVDKVIGGNTSLGEGVDNLILPWATGGDALWSRTTSVYHNPDEGHDSVECVLSAEGDSYLQTALVGPGVLTFWWMATTGASDLSLFLDGNYKAWCLTETWEQRTIDIPSGGHVVKWGFENYAAATHAARVDQVVYTPGWLTLNEAVEYSGYPMQTYGSNPDANWNPLDDPGAWGLDLARSGPIDHNQNSFLETTVRGPGLLTFNWKVSSQANSDYLEFLMGDRSLVRITGQVGWQTHGFVLPPGDNALTWLYWKDESGAAGLDCGWLDKIDVQPLLPLPEALDNSALDWKTYASSPSGAWVGQSLDAFQGQSSARSGPISSKQSAQLVTDVTGPGTLGFHWKVECHDYWNYLSVSLGTRDPEEGSFTRIVWQEKDKITNRVDWQQGSVAVPEGAHHVMWKYYKSGTFSDDGADCGWVDRVIWQPDPTATPAPSSTPTPTPTEAPVCEGIECVVIHFYREVLDREPSLGEVDAWHYGYFDWMVAQNVDVRLVPSEMGRQFFLSQEYGNRDTDAPTFVTDCYNAFLYRNPSQAELDGWGDPANRKETVSIFANSAEFQDRVAAMFPDMEGDPTRNFVCAMYLGLLDRLPDPGGLEAYSNAFGLAVDKLERAKQMGREVSASDEYAQKRSTDALRVESMYRSYLGRYPSNSETEYWTGQVGSGASTLEDLIDAFADSQEFANRLAQFFGG